MIDSMKIIRLDLLTIKSYWRQIALTYVFVSLAVMPGLPQAVNIVYFVLASSFLMYPFMVEQQNGMSRFYSAIAINSSAVVKAKYLSSVIYMLVTVMILGPTNLFIYKIMQAQIPLYMTLGSVVVGMTLYSLVVAIQLPYCFKYGYAKSKVITMILPIAIGLGIPSGAFIAIKLLGKEMAMEFFGKGINFISHHYAGIGIGCLLLAASCMIFSYRTSLRIYTPS